MSRASSPTASRILTVLVLIAMAVACPASAEVRFGRGVRIGGHDFSHQTYGRGRRLDVTLYDRSPPRAGCTWRTDGRGGRVKVCHLRRGGRR